MRKPLRVDDFSAPLELVPEFIEGVKEQHRPNAWNKAAQDFRARLQDGCPGKRGCCLHWHAAWRQKRQESRFDVDIVPVFIFHKMIRFQLRLWMRGKQSLSLSFLTCARFARARWMGRARLRSLSFVTLVPSFGRWRGLHGPRKRLKISRPISSTGQHAAKC